jgi:hypothetical protein
VALHDIAQHLGLAFRPVEVVAAFLLLGLGNFQRQPRAR